MSGVRFTEDDLRKNPRYAHLVAGLRERRPSKYHNVITETDDGRFDSKREAQRFAQLKTIERAALITGLARQVRFRLMALGPNHVQHIEDYIADFLYFDIPNRKWIVEDAKGHRTRDFTRKKRLMLDLYGIDVIET